MSRGPRSSIVAALALLRPFAADLYRDGKPREQKRGGITYDMRKIYVRGALAQRLWLDGLPLREGRWTDRHTEALQAYAEALGVRLGLGTLLDAVKTVIAETEARLTPERTPEREPRRREP